jgi:hypothetical protein
VARDTKEEAPAKSGKPRDANTGAAQQAPVAQAPRPDPSPVWSLLSSHPDTVQRAIELEQGHAPHCGKG